MESTLNAAEQTERKMIYLSMVGNLGIGRLVDAVGATWALIGAGIVLTAGFVLSALAGSIFVLSLMQPKFRPIKGFKQPSGVSC